MRISPHSLTAFILFIMVLSVYAVMAAYYPVGYLWLTYEDLYGEWTQTFFFLVALVFSISIVRGGRRNKLFFALLSIACFYVVMEEISWGQRLFGFATPEFLSPYNLQHEANVHNILTGPFDTWLKRSLGYGLSAGFICYGLIYPLMLRSPWRWPRRLETSWLPAPPLYLWPFFTVAAFLELDNLNFNEAEIAEVLIGGAMAMFCGHYWLVVRNGLDVHQSKSWPSAVSSKLALLHAGISGVTLLLAVSATHILYQDPVIKADIDIRLLNGYEKFADRYAGYARWQQAAALYLRVLKHEPMRTSVMRRLAEVYRNNDDTAGFNKYNQMSLNTLLAMQADSPDKTSTNLALSFTYRQRGLVSKATYYLQQAHALAKQRYSQAPDSANSAYWLAKTYRALGDSRSASEYYRQAFEREPGSTKFRKAYYAMMSSGYGYAAQIGDDD